MKKVKYLSLAALIFATSIQSCNKTELKPNLQSENTVAVNQSNLIKGLSEEFIKGESKIPAEKISPFWRRVIGADLTGFGAGALAGMGAGALIAGVGAIPGGIIGGVFGGAGASFTKAGEEVPPPAMTDNGTVIHNGNPYDFMGIVHYDIVNEIQNHKSEYFSNNELDMQKYKTLVFDKLKLKYQDCDGHKGCFSNDFYLNEINFHANREGNIVSYFEQNNPRLSTMSEEVRNIIKDYSQAIQSTNKKSNFTQYSIQAEDIIKGSNLSETDKFIILSYMSTARIGIAYYD